MATVITSQDTARSGNLCLLQSSITFLVEEERKMKSLNVVARPVITTGKISQKHSRKSNRSHPYANQPVTISASATTSKGSILSPTISHSVSHPAAFPPEKLPPPSKLPVILTLYMFSHPSEFKGQGLRINEVFMQKLAGFFFNEISNHK